MEQSQDHMGRWVTQTMKGYNRRQVTVISAYQAVTDSQCTGIMTVTSQQRNILVQSRDSLSEPRKAFKRDLSELLRRLITRGDEIILVGDFNETIDHTFNGLCKIVADCHLVDLMSGRSTIPFPATYARGRHRLDFGFATRYAASALKYAGYEAFNERFPTDHRAYFFDFDTDKLFGNFNQTLVTPPQRKLQSNNVKQVTQYIREKYRQLEQCNAFRRGDKLMEPGNRHEHAERLDKDIIRASLSAEKSVQKCQFPAWSVALAKARTKIVMLTKCLSMLRTGYDISSAIQKHLQDGACSDTLFPRNKEECVQQLRSAKKEVKDIIRESFLRREEEQQRKIEALEASARKADKQQAKIIRRIRRAEALKKLQEAVNKARTTKIRQGVTRLEIPKHPDDDPKNCTEWQTIDVPSEIVHHLQTRNQKHFGQAQGTPFTVPPLSTALQFSGDGGATPEILSGNWDFSQPDDNVALLLNHLKISEEMEQVQSSATISEEDFTGKLKVWKESTTTSPSGVHLGHYKALIARHEYSNVQDADEDPTTVDTNLTELRDELNTKQQSIRQLHLQLINYALERGYSYRRWQNVANTILFKEPGNIKLHRTRVIHLYEADYNLVLGLKWRAALYQAEARELLHEGQFGSRPRRNAIDPVMLEELQFEASRVSRKMFLQLNYDATACYDRIIPNLATIVSQQHGVHKQVTLMNARTLQKASYHIRTEMGLSETSYSHSDESPIYGTGQGSGNSPMIWCFLSSVLYQCYDTSASAATYSNPDRSNQLSLSMIGFVDDSNGQVNMFDKDDTIGALSTMHMKATQNAATWANLLGATGGSLELSKCSYHLLFWRFSAQGAPVLASCPPEYRRIEVTDPISGQVHQMEYLPPQSAHKTLGHYKEPVGTQRTQYHRLQAKSNAITEFLWSTPLSRAESWLFYHACYLPAVCYPLTCSHLSKRQLESIQRRAMAIIIARCGYNRNTKKEILFGPVEYGGASFYHLYEQQGIQQVKYFLRHWRLTTIVGKMLKCVLAWTQLSIGVSYPILEHTKTNLPHLEAKWLASLRLFLSTINAGVQVDDPCIPSLQRQGDSYIMDHILEAGIFSSSEVRRLNYCRLYLQAVTISDLTKITGDILDPSKLSGHPSLQSSQTNWITINQDRPSEKEWVLWRKANKLWSNMDGQLHSPLRKWCGNIHQQRNHHFAYRYRRRVWIRTYEKHYQECRINHRGFIHERGQIRKFEHLPPGSVPVELNASTTGMWKLSLPIFSIERPPVISFSGTATFDAYINTLEAWEIDLLRHITLDLDPFSICLVANRRFRAVSDGSVLSTGQTSYGWILSTHSGDRVAEGMGPARGLRVHSYRAEACGILSFLRFLIRIGHFTQMHEQWQGTLATDSQSVLDTLFGRDCEDRNDGTPLNLDGNRVVLDALCPEWDVLIEIQTALRALPGVRLQYVEGHQDKKKPYHTLTLLEQLNVDADRIAAEYHELLQPQRPFILMSPNAKAHLVHMEGTVTAKYDEFIATQATAPPLQKYLADKHSWSDVVVETINWKAHGQALKKNKARRSHFVKFVHDILPTTSLRNKYDGGKRTCPLCQHPREDRDHILRCPHSSRSEWRQQLVQALTKYCRDTNTYPAILRLLVSTLQRWLSGEDNPQIDTAQHPPDIRANYTTTVEDRMVPNISWTFHPSVEHHPTAIHGKKVSHASPHRRPLASGINTDDLGEVVSAVDQ